jgi:hypothetical protein
MYFAVPSNNVDIIRHVTEFLCFGMILRHKREEYGDGNVEPEEYRLEVIVVTAESASGEPTRRNY